MLGRSTPRKPSKERLLEFKGQIKKACDESIREPDVVQNIAITDALNSNPLLDERADKTLRKLINHKSPQIAINAINLLQCVMQNCEHFIPYVARELFMETLKKNIPKRFYLQQVIQMKSHPDLLEAERIDKTLVLFLNLSKIDNYPLFKRHYEKLVAKGIKFPEVLDDEQLIIGKPKPILHKQPRGGQDKKGKTKVESPVVQRDGEQQVQVVDVECKTYMDHAKMLSELLTESDSTANLQSDEIIQQVLRSVKQGTNTIGLRLGGEGQPQLMSQLMVTYEELAHAQDYYTGLVNGKAIRSHNKTDRFRTGQRSSEPAPQPVAEQDMSKLSEQQQMALAMKESIKLQQDQEEKRKKEAVDAETKAKKDQDEKKKKPTQWV